MDPGILAVFLPMYTECRKLCLPNLKIHLFVHSSLLNTLCLCHLALSPKHLL